VPGRAPAAGLEASAVGFGAATDAGVELVDPFEFGVAEFEIEGVAVKPQ